MPPQYLHRWNGPGILLGMNVFITGIDGCVGSHAAEHLRGAGCSVYGSVFLRPPGTKEYYADLRAPEPFKDIQGKRFDAVVHTAGIVDQDRGRGELHRINATGTAKTLSWARTAGTRHFIHISSTSVYGIRTMGEQRTESTPVRRGIPFVPYSAAKIKAERSVRASGIPYTILRLPAVIGAGDAMFSRAITEAIVNKTMFRCGEGEKLVSLISAGNIGCVLEKVLIQGPANDCFNCADYHIPWNRLIEHYTKVLRSPCRVKKKHPISMYLNLRNKNFLLIASHSFYGAHYPNTKLLRTFTPVFSQSLEESVRAAAGMCV